MALQMASLKTYNAGMVVGFLCENVEEVCLFYQLMDYNDDWLVAGMHFSPKKPDVLVIVLDTVRADHLSTYGYHRQTSPELSALAENGVLFRDVTASSSWTWPSHASIFTGLLPWDHGAHRAQKGTQFQGSDWFLSGMSSEVPTLAEAFNEHGYRSYAFSTNALLSKDLGLMRGFTRVEATEDEQKTMNLALSAIKEKSDKPLFLFVNVMTAHAPYLVTRSVGLVGTA